MSITHIEGESDAYLECVVKIDASVKKCAAESFNLKSRVRMKDNDRKDACTRSKSHNRHSQDN